MKFTPEHEQISDTVRKFVANEINPHLPEWEKAGQFPAHQLFKKMGDLGLLGIKYPTEFGGMGLDFSYSMVMAEALGECKAGGVPMAIGVQTDMCTPALARFGSDALRHEFLAPAISGDMVGCIGVSEVGGGSDVAALKTTARKDGSDYIINGSKMWITNGPDADTLVVYAKSEPELGARGVSAFLIEKGMKGFSVAQKLDKLGMRGSHTGELVFNNVEVPAENILGGLNNGAKVLMSGLDYERAVLSGGPLGIMQSVMDNVIPYIHDRKQFGQSIGEFQLIQGKVADMYTVLQAGRSFAYTVAKNLDLLGAEHVRQVRKDCASVILWTAEKATWMAGEGVQIFGGNGYINEYPLGRLWRDAKLYEIGAGTSEIRRMLIGRELFAETM
jgi:isovaleryl-CoA dehydrogenase